MEYQYNEQHSELKAYRILDILDGKDDFIPEITTFIQLKSNLDQSNLFSSKSISRRRHNRWCDQRKWTIQSVDIVSFTPRILLLYSKLHYNTTVQTVKNTSSQIIVSNGTK